jgi:hypothetical protein
MAFPIGRILMAYRPLYLRGLLMDGQYGLPKTPPPPARGKTEETSTEVVAQRAPACTVKPLRGATSYL